MWSRASIADELAQSLWESIGQTGRAPRHVCKAGDDLATLYEEANGTSLPDIARRIHRVAPDLAPEVVGEWLAQAAVGDAADHAADVMAQAGIGAPTFAIVGERRRGELEVSWEGSPERRNPPRAAGNYMMLLEDDPALQDGTGRWMKKLFDIPLLVVDNVDAAIANLQHHEVSLVVSDVDVVGDKSGIDLFHYVQQHYPALVDRYIFFTGNSAAEREHYRYLPKGGATSKDLKAAIMAPRPGGGRTRATVAPKVASAQPVGAPSVTDVVNVVRDVAPSIQPKDGPGGKPKTRIGDRKIFISALWRAAFKDPRVADMSYDDFKHALLDAHRQRLLTLARADLVAAMDDGAVAASELDADGAQFHFVIDPKFGGIAVPPAPAARTSGPIDPVVLLAAVRAALPNVPTEGRYGNDNVFVSALWEAVAPQFPGLTLPAFKKWLVAANRAQQIVMARADMVDDMPAKLVDASEIDDLGAHFHFVLDRKAQVGRPSVHQIVHAVLAAIPQVRPSEDSEGRWMGRVGEDKVFIYPIWKIVSRQYPDLSRSDFDRALVDANQRELISLARLDSRGDANPQESMESEITSLGAAFHFVMDPHYRRQR